MIDLVKTRETLHQIPEIGFTEVATKEYLLSQLNRLGGVIHEVGETGLVVFFDNGKADTLAFRTDMDALPVTETADISFKSRHVGVMHACGHDGHMTMLLGLADFVAQNRDSLRYNVVLIFQPAEELSGGAEAIVASGLLESYNVRAVFGFHVWPGLPAGQVFTRTGGLMAMSSETNITVHGKSAHIASSASGIDSIEVAAKLLTEIYAWDKTLDFFHLLKFGELHAGTIRNVLAETAVIRGSLRSLDKEKQRAMKQTLREIADKFERTSGAQILIDYTDGCPPVINDAALMEKLSALASLRELTEPVLQAEDFGVYCEKYPSVFFFLGLGDVPALHTADFHFDSKLLGHGVNFYKEILTLDF
jgi:hippurate hydrolase